MCARVRACARGMLLVFDNFLSALQIPSDCVSTGHKSAISLMMFVGTAGLKTTRRCFRAESRVFVVCFGLTHPLPGTAWMEVLRGFLCTGSGTLCRTAHCLSFSARLGLLNSRL